MMTKEEMRIAIAEACPLVFDLIEVRGAAYQVVYRDDVEHNGCLAEIVDPLSDLNAMHEAEKVLTEKQHETFRRILRKVCNGSTMYVNSRQQISSSASQRAEAFCRTLYPERFK